MLSLLELAAEPGSTSRSHLLPAKIMSNLAQLCLVCFQYCTTHGSSTEGRSGDSSTSKRLLFDAVVQLLLTETEIIKDMLSLLLKIVSGKGKRVLKTTTGSELVEFKESNAFYLRKAFIRVNMYSMFLAENSESVKQNSAVILIKMLSCDLRNILLRFADIVQQIVPRILVRV